MHAVDHPTRHTYGSSLDASTSGADVREEARSSVLTGLGAPTSSVGEPVWNLPRQRREAPTGPVDTAQRLDATPDSGRNTDSHEPAYSLKPSREGAPNPKREYSAPRPLRLSKTAAPGAKAVPTVPELRRRSYCEATRIGAEFAHPPVAGLAPTAEGLRSASASHADVTDASACPPATRKAVLFQNRAGEFPYGIGHPLGCLSALSPAFEMPVVIQGCECIALLDSGATDNFVARSLSDRLSCRKRPLRHPFGVKVANGQVLLVEQYLRVSLHFKEVSLRMSLRVMDIGPQVILGWPFLQRFNPRIDWVKRALVFPHHGQEVVIHANVHMTPDSDEPEPDTLAAKFADHPRDDFVAAAPFVEDDVRSISPTPTDVEDAQALTHMLSLRMLWLLSRQCRRVRPSRKFGS